MKLSDATETDIQNMMKKIAEENNLDISKLSDDDKHSLRTEATMCFSWICE